MAHHINYNLDVNEDSVMFVTSKFITSKFRDEISIKFLAYEVEVHMRSMAVTQVCADYNSYLKIGPNHKKRGLDCRAVKHNSPSERQ